MEKSSKKKRSQENDFVHFPAISSFYGMEPTVTPNSIILLCRRLWHFNPYQKTLLKFFDKTFSKSDRIYCF